MAHFINCSSCGKQYNDQAFDKCPHCGFKPNPSSGTVFCPNKLCGKEVSDQFEKCPFCGTPLHKGNSTTAELLETKTETRTTKYVERSGWYTYATVMLVLSFIGLAILTIASIATENIVFLIVGLGEFIMFSLFCGIVQLLAGIKHGIDNMK